MTIAEILAKQGGGSANCQDGKLLELDGACNMLAMLLFENVYFEAQVENIHASNSHGVQVYHRKFKPRQTHFKHFEPSIDFK